MKHKPKEIISELKEIYTQVPIKVWKDKEFVYFENVTTLRDVWGAKTSNCDMREPVTRDKLGRYKMPISLLIERKNFLRRKLMQYAESLEVIEKVLLR